MSIFDDLRNGVRCATAEDTMELARVFGEALPINQVVTLNGDLGAGKTTFVKGLGQALGIPRETITSPTYNIYTLHQGTRQLVHIDGYRLSGKAVDDLLIEEFLVDPWLIAVEWPERALTDWMAEVTWSLQFNRDPLEGLFIELINFPLTANEKSVKLF